MATDFGKMARPTRWALPIHHRDLSNAQWETLNALISLPVPRRDGRGRPWKDRRSVSNGILWVLRTGAPWADVPERYPSYQTCNGPSGCFQR